MQFRIVSGGIAEEFLNSRAKIQVFAGGFANGKTATTCVKAIQLARDYPGSNGLIARATYPKLCDTILVEWKKWLPEDWIKSFTKSNDRPTYVLKNNTVVNFRYVQQQKRAGSSTSNLLSATYDWIVVDQFDDPEFVYKDFTDLLGRLRGGTKYTGTDPSMPISGPRWLICTSNPTRNWFYKDIVKSIIDYKNTGHVSDRLAEQLAKMEVSDVDQFIHLVQGPTTANAHNLSEDYVRSLQATYSGTMADRYIKGDWGAFTGLVYPDFDPLIHMVPEGDIRRWKFSSKTVQWLECFDFGLRTPTCYMLAFRDAQHNVVFVDGFKEKELSPEDTVRRIKAIRRQWAVPKDTDKPIYADPSTFRRSGTEYRTVGKSVAEVFRGNGLGVTFTRGNNDIKAGIVKVRSYLALHERHEDPFTHHTPAPFVYFSRDKLGFLEDEITDYYFEEADDESSEEEKPIDRNDHAMDALKYCLTDVPEIKVILPRKKRDFSHLTRWQEAPDDWSNDGQAHPRYA